MNISFIDYNKKVENLDKKITKYKQKIEDILNSYEERPSGLDELEERDKALYKKYIEVIRKYEKSKTVAQEKARAMAEAGKFPLSRSKKIALGLAAALIVGGGGYAYLNSNQLNLGQSNDKNDTPANNTDSLGQPKNDTMISNNNQNPNIDEPSLDDSTSSEVEYVDGQTPSVSDNNETTNGETNDEPQLPNSYNEPTEKVESLYETVLTDINDEEQVYARAKYIKENYYDVYLPQQYVTIEEVEEQIRQVGAGICKSVSVNDATFAINTINNLMFREMGDAVDRLNNVESRGETPGTLDLGLFCVDGTKGQMLLHQLSELRTAMIQGAGRTDISDLQVEYAELFLSSLLLQGYSSTDINSLETGGMKYLASITFQNAAPLCGEAKKLMIYDPIRCVKRSFYDITNEFNYTLCTVNMIDENGELTEDVEDLNIMGSFLVEMVSNNYTKKAMFDENFGRTLK